MPYRNPPPSVPVRTYPSPKLTDQVLIEWVNNEVGNYTPLDIGSEHPNSREFPGFFLGAQQQNPTDHNFIQRIWVTEQTSVDAFNYAIKFSAEDNSFPAFIRTYREPKSTYAPRAKQSTLGTLYKLVLDDDNKGSGYAQGALPLIIFDTQVPAPDSVALGHGVVAPDGSISECVIGFGGEGYVENVKFRVEDPLNGNPATGTAYVQPQSAILVKEEANLYPEDSPFYAQYLQVTRVYETIPGPTLTGTKFDSDGDEITVGTTRKLCSDITTQQAISSGSWCKTTSRPTDIDFICEEVVECRPIPGTEIDAITYPYGPNGRRVTASRLVQRSTYTRTVNGTANANFPSALLVDERLDPVEGTNLVARKIGIYDEIPSAANQQGLGYFVEYPYDGDPNFPRLTWRFQVLRLSATTVADLSACPISGFTSLKLVDQKTEEADELIEVKIVRTYEILPGKPIPKTEIAKDSKVIDTVRTKKDESTITSQEEITGGGIWKKTYKEPIGGGVAWEVVEARDALGNTLSSAKIDGDQEVQNISTRLRAESAITPSSTESGGFITTVEKGEVSDLEAQEITTVTRWLDKAEYAKSIINLIPREFMAFVPTFTESHILAGTASMPTLAAGEFEHSKRQLTKLLYEERIVSLGSVSLPITHTNQETTEEYGGGVLNVTYILETQGSGTINEGLLVTESTLTDLGNGMEVKLTKELDDTAWPVIASRLWDENYRVEYDETRQVVDAGASEDPDPGGGFAWVSEVKGIDKWRSLIINTAKPEPDYNSEANALISYEYKPYRFPGLLYYGNGHYVRHADATLVQHKIKTWWLKSGTTPTVGPTGGGADVEIDEIILDDVVINNLTNTAPTYSGPVLHDDVTFGTLFYPATTPSYTQYALGTPTGTTLQNIASIFSPGSGFSNGDVLTIAAGGFTMTVTVTSVYDVGATTGIIGTTTAIDPSGTFPAGTYGPILATGGGGTNGYFNVWAVMIPTYTSGTEWIGTYRVIGADIKPEKEKDVWRIVTESVVMR